ncbi:Vi polysaccharide biosynthesis UDP-N-acetylglucosamine C-6 dehydrogenase TviB [Alphaproteobacteria bacterium]|nr:Vi polysaccharide biosynthesis UDP-N-acetylglucosamine C-6 dehydrogenase TviB [Alphaproteobacteria bacterium]
MKVYEKTIAVVGLGYVGLPLAVEFGKNQPVIGFDINKERVESLNLGVDSTFEVNVSELSNAKHIIFTSDPKELTKASIYIITVPTPINKHKQPDLSHLLRASELVGKVLNINDIVIYESTVYPGATEYDCIPVLEKFSGLSFNTDFFVGYSPERINPGDKDHTLKNIIKVTSGSTPEIAEQIDELYQSIITAGTYKAKSIKVAEAAKVIENTQRDVNIGLINELAIIFNKLGIDTEEVLMAAGTKWNFLPFRPGLVGGHCIGVDPYYLTHKAQSVGYYPEIVLAGRRINDGMKTFVVSQLVKKMLKMKIDIEGSRVLIMGLTFKENCPDLRNSKVIEIITELEEYGAIVDACDPWVNIVEAKSEYKIIPASQLIPKSYDAIIIAVAHKEFKDMGGASLRALGKQKHVLYDLKYMLNADESDLRL